MTSIQIQKSCPFIDPKKESGRYVTGSLLASTFAVLACIKDNDSMTGMMKMWHSLLKTVAEPAIKEMEGKKASMLETVHFVATRLAEQGKQYEKMSRNFMHALYNGSGCNCSCSTQLIYAVFEALRPKIAVHLYFYMTFSHVLLLLREDDNWSAIEGVRYISKNIDEKCRRIDLDEKLQLPMPREEKGFCSLNKSLLKLLNKRIENQHGFVLTNDPNVFINHEILINYYFTDEKTAQRIGEMFLRSNLGESSVQGKMVYMNFLMEQEFHKLYEKWYDNLPKSLSRELFKKIVRRADKLVQSYNKIAEQLYFQIARNYLQDLPECVENEYSKKELIQFFSTTKIISDVPLMWEELLRRELNGKGKLWRKVYSINSKSFQKVFDDTTNLN